MNTDTMRDLREYADKITADAACEAGVSDADLHRILNGEVDAGVRASRPLIERWPFYFSRSTGEGWIIHPSLFRQADHAWLVQHEDAICVTNAYDVIDSSALTELARRSFAIEP